MKVKIFDENHEKDLENAINDFLDDDIELIDIKYEVSVSIFSDEQVFCFSAMIIYRQLTIKKKDDIILNYVGKNSNK